MNNTTKEKSKIEFEKVLVSVGRKPYTDGLNLSKIGINKDKKRRIDIDKEFRTSVKNIFHTSR